MLRYGLLPIGTNHYQYFNQCRFFINKILRNIWWNFTKISHILLKKINVISKESVFFCRPQYVNSLRHKWVIKEFGQQVMACCLRAPSHYLNQCWLFMTEIINRKKSWKLNQNAIFFQQNLFENVICEMPTILFRPHCVNSLLVNIG